MTKCKWCEKDFENDDTYFPDIIYCNFDCQIMYEKHGMRQIIHNFAQEIELAMQEKDKFGYTNRDKSLEFLVNKLREERAEVDYELKNLPSENIDKELLHEAIMTMLVRQRMKDLGKYAKLND